MVRNENWGFLAKTAFQGTNITSAMFMTAMAANPLVITLAADVAGVEITWTGWMIAACTRVSYINCGTILHL